MESPLLETKLYVPRPRRGLVARPRLSERLNRGAASKLTLISAPPGFGKTTLLAEWLASAPARERSAAWLSLDSSDNQPTSFWPYLIAALQTVLPGVGARALALLQEPQAPPIETVLATLLNELSGAPNDIVLVLDDYHEVDTHDIQGGMAFLLEHLPHQLHLVVTTRAAAGPPAGARRARRDPCRRSALHRRRGRRVPKRRDGPRPGRPGHYGAGRAHRGLDRCPTAGGAVDAGPRRRRRLHRRLRRG
jgi:LuxR family maltose regulon positive regulatory protein